MGGLQSRSECCGVAENVSYLPGIEPEPSSLELIPNLAISAREAPKYDTGENVE
jgi:hypothetical protein